MIFIFPVNMQQSSALKDVMNRKFDRYGVRNLKGIYTELAVENSVSQY
jgi:hypothetical protein